MISRIIESIQRGDWGTLFCNIIGHATLKETYKGRTIVYQCPRCSLIFGSIVQR